MFSVECRVLIPFLALFTLCSNTRHDLEQPTRPLSPIQSLNSQHARPAAAEIERILRSSGPDSARTRFREIHTDLTREFYVDEREFNALGYKFLRQERKLPEAIAIFEMNTQAFPESWNAWDSLAEAYYFSGNPDEAESCYAKSLALNPNNVSGRNNLSRLRGHKLDMQGETTESIRFQPGVSTGLQGPYLGQTAPDTIPKVFAPGIVSTAGNYEFSTAFTPDGREIYFTRRQEPGGSNTVMVSRWRKDGWTAPEAASFCKGYPCNEPHITSDGRKLYFGSERHKPGTDRPEYGIWVVERAGQDWGEPRYHGPGMFVSSSRSGNLYMTDITNIAGRGVIIYSLVDGNYGLPRLLGGGVNSPTEASHAVVAPDESYIIFDSYNRPGGQGGEGDLWVCFKKPDGSWTEGFNLGDQVNTPATNFCPALSSDGKFLFYSTCHDIYWVSIKIISRFRPGSPK